MHKQVIELYKQAAEFAYKTAGADAGKGTIIESLTAGKFAELIVRECIGLCYRIDTEYEGKKVKPTVIASKVAEHFGVEE